MKTTKANTVLNVKIITKTGHEDQEIWDYLLSNDIGLKSSTNGITNATIPKSLMKELEKLGTVEVIKD